MLQQHQRYCCGDRLRVSALSCSDIGSVVPAFSGAGSWNTKKNVCRAPDAIYPNAIRQGCHRDMADCYTGTMEWLVNLINDAFLRQEVKIEKYKRLFCSINYIIYLQTRCRSTMKDTKETNAFALATSASSIWRLNTILISFLLCPIHPVVQFVSVANVKYPYEYQRFLDGVKLLDFDLGWMLSASCVVGIDFHDRLLFATIGPIVVILLLAMTYYIAARRNQQSEGALQSVQHKHLSAVILLTFMVYSNVSSILFQTFACEHLEDGELYLRADYRIECDSAKHDKLQVYAAIMIIIYTFGIPVFYATFLLKNRDILKTDESSRNNCSRVLPTSSLWKPYKPRVFYFEAIECIRRALLVGVVVFFNPNTASQIAVTLILAFTFVVISESLDPYASRWNTWLSRTGNVVVFFTVYVALLLKVNVSSERRDSQRAFEVVLVVFNACMIVAVIIQALVMTCSLEGLVGRRRDDGILPDAYTRLRLMRWIVGSRTV